MVEVDNKIALVWNRIIYENRRTKPIFKKGFVLKRQKGENWYIKKNDGVLDCISYFGHR